MIPDLVPLKDKYGPCEKLIVKCYLVEEYGVDSEKITAENCIGCAYNWKREKPFKPKANELENKVNENDRISMCI